MEKYFQKIIFFILSSTLFIFPFFFLNFTQEFFITNKFYLLSLIILLLILISNLYFLISKKIPLLKQPFDNFILLFLTTITLSVIFSSPNKIQALLNLNFGLMIMVSLVILYFYLSRSYETIKQFTKLAIFSSLFLSILTITLFFLKNPSFTTLGNKLDLAIFLGFFVLIQTLNIIKKQYNGVTMKQLLIDYLPLIINFLALFLTVYSLTKANIILPPFRLSWYAALEVLKTPQTAFFGAGIDNFSSVFTRVKDLAYNQSSLWQINTFNVSHSAILQIFTETGILGLITFVLLIFSVIKSALVKTTTNRQYIFLFLYLLICLFIFPPSFIVWFLFFISLAITPQRSINETMKQPLNLSKLPIIYVGIALIIFGAVGVFGYFLGRSYASEYYFKRSLNGITRNNLKEVYDNQKQAIILNPYIERFRGNFAQTNLVIANNLVQKPAKEITAQDKQTVTQSIQSAIAEAKAVVSLNPQKADNWKNLADIYRNIISVAQGSDSWTISAYQRAIILDPQNPLYRIDLGGVYYLLGKYDDAVKFFEQAIELKPNWPNAHYNYAWASYQKGDYSQAASAMQNVINLLNPKLNKADYEKAQKDLEEFKKKLSK